MMYINHILVALCDMYINGNHDSLKTSESVYFKWDIFVNL